MTRIQFIIAAVFITLVATIAVSGARAQGAPVTPASAYSAEQPAAPQPLVQSQAPISNQPDVTARDVGQLRHEYELLKKDFERLDSQVGRDLDAQSSRIADLHSNADWFAILITAFAILIAMGAGISFISATRSAVGKAKDWLMEDAKAQSKELSDNLVKETKSDLEAHIVELKQSLQKEVEKSINDAETHFSSMMNLVDEKRKEAENILKRAQEALQEGDGAKVSEADKSALEVTAEMANAKAEGERTYSDWLSLAVATSLQKDYSAAARAYDHAALLADATQVQVAHALFGKAWALNEAERTDEALAAYGEVLTRFGDAKESALLEFVAKALVNKGVVLGTVGRMEDELAANDEVLTRFGDAKEAALLKQVAMALFNKGNTLDTAGRTDEALAAYGEVLTRFGDAKEVALLEFVASALVNKGVVLGTVGRTEDELAAYGEVLTRFGDAKEAALLGSVAKALANKGITLNKAQRTEEAFAAQEDVVRRFGDSEAPELREMAASALNSLADVRRNQAKILWQNVNKVDEAKTLLITSLTNLNRALESGSDVVVQHAAANKAYALYLLGDTENNIEDLLRQALKLGGQKMFDAILEDIAKHSLPQDEGYRALVERVWAEEQAAHKGAA